MKKPKNIYQTIKIGIKINIDNVKLIKIDDITNRAGECQYNHSDQLFWLLLNKPIGKGKLVVNIKSPCLEKSPKKVKIKLTIVTSSKKSYYKTLEFKSMWIWFPDSTFRSASPSIDGKCIYKDGTPIKAEVRLSSNGAACEIYQNR